MTPTTISPSPPSARQAPFERALAAPACSGRRTAPPTRRGGRGSPRAPCAGAPSSLATCAAGPAIAQREPGRLAAYTTASGRVREVIAGRRRDGCVLIVDRDALTRGDRRLVACLDPDEPARNAALVCSHYLRDPRRGRCRRVSVRDLTGEHSVAREPRRPPSAASLHRTELVARCAEGDGWAYRLELVRTGGLNAELRWCRRSRRARQASPSLAVCLREVIGELESYEPACELTLAALRVYREDPRVSTTPLRVQLERIRQSPIVLNRQLRQAVLVAVEREGISLSEIALRCGRVKRDSRGNRSGETSWLARRVGILPESGADRHTPWVHSDVMALIAREGLGISPREVELG